MRNKRIFRFETFNAILHSSMEFLQGDICVACPTYEYCQNSIPRGIQSR